MHPSTSEGDLDFLVVASMFLTFGDTYSETHSSMGEDYGVKEHDYLSALIVWQNVKMKKELL